MEKITIWEYMVKNGRYVKQEKEAEAEFIDRKEAIRRRLHIVNARTQVDGRILFVYQDDAGAYFYNITNGPGK